MYLKKLKVQNFRMLKDVEMQLFHPDDKKRDDRFSLIVGKNNTGKTSVLKILECMLPATGGSSFEWDDLTMSYQEELFHCIGDLKKFSEYKPYGIRLVLYVNYNNNDSFEILRAFMMDLDEKNQTVKIECNYRIKENQFVELSRDINAMGIEKFVDFASYMRRNIRKYFSFEYFTLSDCGKYREEVSKADLQKLIRLRSINANRDISNRKNDHSLSNISDRLYRLIEGTDSEQFIGLQKAIKNTDLQLTKTYSNVFKGVLDAAKNFGAADNNAEIKILSTIQEKDLLKDNTTLFYNKENVYLPESYNGLGYLNLIGMIFGIEAIAKEFDKINKENQGLNILFIEEPEAHTHPQLQYVFIKNIKKLLQKHSTKGIQTIMTTHSSHIVSECDFEDIIYFTRVDGYSNIKSFWELKDQYEDSTGFSFIKKHLHLTRAELFFADKAILIEGDTERILMRSMMEKIDSEYRDSDCRVMPLQSQNISIVEVGSHAHIFEHLLDFLNIKALIITDLDYGKKNKNNGRIAKCDYSSEGYIGNQTIIKFLGKQGDACDEIINLTAEEKIKENRRIAYQTKECGIEEKYPGRSFEEAFININFHFIEKNKDTFASMKNREEFTEDKSPYELAKRCIDKKTTFATDLLYHGDGWKIPEYIIEGLKWLRQ